MSKQEMDQSLSTFAISESQLYLSKMLKLNRVTTYQVIMRQVCKAFKHYREELQSVQILEIADLEFHVTINGHAKSVFMLERKEAQHAR